MKKVLIFSLLSICFTVSASAQEDFIGAFKSKAANMNCGVSVMKTNGEGGEEFVVIAVHGDRRGDETRGSPPVKIRLKSFQHFMNDKNIDIVDVDDYKLSGEQFGSSAELQLKEAWSGVSYKTFYSSFTNEKNNPAKARFTFSSGGWTGVYAATVLDRKMKPDLTENSAECFGPFERVESYEKMKADIAARAVVNAASQATPSHQESETGSINRAD